MRETWLLAGGFALSLALAAAAPGVRAHFVGGTLPVASVKTNARIDLTGGDSLVFSSSEGDLRVAYSRINTIEYGQNVSRHYVAAVLISPMFLLSKSRQHFITLGYVDAQGQQQVLVFRVDKHDIRSVLAGLEARTGRRVEYQDADARKASKG